MLAVKSGFPGIMRFLLDAGANPNIPDEVSFTCFPVLLLSLVIIYFSCICCKLADIIVPFFLYEVMLGCRLLTLDRLG